MPYTKLVKFINLLLLILFTSIYQIIALININVIKKV